ncbi:MAG: hypothetical protein RL207_714 [Bacteroidota bacterium]|jgi:hypothetical protein
MIYLCSVNLIRRFCLFFCALGVFLNVTLGNIVFGDVITPSKSHSESKQIALRKVAVDVNFNSFEFEEDVELDEDGSEFDQDLDLVLSSIETPLLTFNTLTSSKYSYFTHRLRWEKLPLFIQFQNFRI